MRQITSSLIYIFQPKLIVFGLALSNFFYIYRETSNNEKVFCLYCPWYETETVNNVPTLLVAALLLLISRWWSYLLAVFLGGYITIYGLNLFLTRPIGFLEHWKFIQEYELTILLQWEIQFILAVLILSCGIFYLIRERNRKSIRQ